MADASWRWADGVRKVIDPKLCKGCDVETTKPNRFEVDGEPYCLDCGPDAVAVGKQFEATLRGKAGI